MTRYRAFVWACVVAILVVMAFTSRAQTRATVLVGAPIYWDYTGTDAAVIAGQVYKLYDGGVAVVPSLPGVRCSWPSATGAGFACKVELPTTLAPGDHDLTVTATAPGKGESAFTTPPLLVTIVLPPSEAPANLRLAR